MNDATQSPTKAPCGREAWRTRPDSQCDVTRGKEGSVVCHQNTRETAIKRVCRLELKTRASTGGLCPRLKAQSAFKQTLVLMSDTLVLFVCFLFLRISSSVVQTDLEFRV